MARSWEAQRWLAANFVGRARDYCEIQSLGRVQSPLVSRRCSHPGRRSGDPGLRTETGAVTAEAVVREVFPARARLPESCGIGAGGCDLVFSRKTRRHFR